MTKDILEIKLLGKVYQVACEPQERQSLELAVQYLDEKIKLLSEQTIASGERLAMMVALNISHEMLNANKSEGFDLLTTKRRINKLNEQFSEFFNHNKS